MLSVIITLTILALLLMAIEVFLVPGFGLPGIAGVACMVAVNVLTASTYGLWASLLSLALSIVLIVLAMWWAARSKTLERLSLHAEIRSTSANADQLAVVVGERGVALTRLALIGNAQIGGRTVEVKSEGGFIEEGTPLVVTRVDTAQVMVRPA